MKARSILQLLVEALTVYHALSADGCDDMWGVRCGDQCTGYHGYCTCGEDAQKFDIRDNTSWCCNASDCLKDGVDIVCKNGTLLPLTSPCQGECNTGISYYAAREYWGCDSKDQCIKIQYVQDEEQHCHDGSDEKNLNQDFYSPIQWDKLSTCGDKAYPGVKCSGQGALGSGPLGVDDDCLVYVKWCTDRVVIKCTELGGRTTVDSAVCSNTTYWLNHPCTYLNYEGERCDSEYIGQCYYPDTDMWYISKTCQERSLPNNGSCPPSYLSCLVVTILPILSKKLLRMLQRCLRAWTRAKREGVFAMENM